VHRLALALVLLAVPGAAIAQTATPAQQLARALQATAELAQLTSGADDPRLAQAAMRAQTALRAAAEALERGELCRPLPVMDARTFEVFLEELRRSEHTSAHRQQLIEQAGARHRFTVEQLARLMGLFAKGAERVEIAAALYDRLDDPQEFERAYALLPFESDRKALALRVAKGAAAP
jgi:tRNA A37 threonylcarbamoyladenosine modification protein TsaB